MSRQKCNKPVRIEKRFCDLESLNAVIVSITARKLVRHLRDDGDHLLVVRGVAHLKANQENNTLIPKTNLILRPLHISGSVGNYLNSSRSKQPCESKGNGGGSSNFTAHVDGITI